MLSKLLVYHLLVYLVFFYLPFGVRHIVGLFTQVDSLGIPSLGYESVIAVVFFGTTAFLMILGPFFGMLKFNFKKRAFMKLADSGYKIKNFLQVDLDNKHWLDSYFVERRAA